MQLQRLSRTVDDMLFLAQAEHGELLPTRQPVALGTEVQALFGALQAQAAEPLSTSALLSSCARACPTCCRWPRKWTCC